MEEKEGEIVWLNFNFKIYRKYLKRKDTSCFRCHRQVSPLSHFHGKPGGTVATASSPSSTLLTGFQHCSPSVRDAVILTLPKPDNTELSWNTVPLFTSLHQCICVHNLCVCVVCMCAHKVCSVHSFLLLPQQWFLRIVLNGGRGTYF